MKALSIISPRARMVFAVLLYSISIHLAYLYIIAPSFSYMGYTYNSSIQATNFLIPLFFCIIPAYFIRLDTHRPSNFVILLQYILVYIPTQYMMTVLDTVIPESLLFRITLLMSIAFLTLTSSRKIRIASVVNISSSLFHILIFGLFLFLVVLVISQFGLAINLASLTDVYDVRSEYKADVEDAGKVFAYAVPYLGILSAFLVGYGYADRHPFFFLLGLISLLYVFGVTGQKSILFSALLVVGLTLLYRGHSNRLAERMIRYTAIIVIIAVASDMLSEGTLFTSLFVRRMILTPGLLTTYYYQFFIYNPPVLLAHSLLNGVIPYPYDVTPPFLIGREYFMSVGMSANANVLADGFSNFRHAGTIIFAGVLGVILAIIDGYSENLRRPVVVLAGVALPAFSLTNSALFTTLLTHGFILSILITYLYSSTNRHEMIDRAQPIEQGETE